MSEEQKVQEIVEFLRKHGSSYHIADDFDVDLARETAKYAIESNQPLIETRCFQILVEHILARIHEPSWISARAECSDGEESQLLKRLLKSGASEADLALFARMSQKEFLSNLGCILDGSGIYGTPKLPCDSFRVFAIDSDGKPSVKIDDLHETLGYFDLETEMNRSRKAEQDARESG